MNDTSSTSHREAAGATPVERMYFAWDDALSRNATDRLLDPYAEDCVFESPLVPHLLGTSSGQLNDRADCARCSTMLAERKRPVQPPSPVTAASPR